MTINVGIFVLAAFFEIAGCFAFWMSLRRGATPLMAVLGVASLIAFAFVLTRVDSAFAGRAYAAYGRIYIAASLVWLWLIEGQAPRRTDLLGAAPAISGALIIIGFAARVRRAPPEPADGQAAWMSQLRKSSRTPSGALLRMVTYMLPCERWPSSNTSTVQDRVHLRLGFGRSTPQQPQK